MSILFYVISGGLLLSTFIFGGGIKMAALMTGKSTGLGQLVIASGVFAIAGALA